MAGIANFSGQVDHRIQAEYRQSASTIPVGLHRRSYPSEKLNTVIYNCLFFFLAAFQLIQSQTNKAANYNAGVQLNRKINTNSKGQYRYAHNFQPTQQ